MSAELEAEIHRLHAAELWPPGAIARQLAIHIDVVHRVLELQAPPLHVPRVSFVDEYVPFMRETLVRWPTLRSTRLFDMLKERGFPGYPRTVREHVARLRPRREREAFLRTHPLMRIRSEPASVPCAALVPSSIGRCSSPGPCCRGATHRSRRCQPGFPARRRRGEGEPASAVDVSIPSRLVDGPAAVQQGRNAAAGSPVLRPEANRKSIARGSAVSFNVVPSRQTRVEAGWLRRAVARGPAAKHALRWLEAAKRKNCW